MHMSLRFRILVNVIFISLFMHFLSHPCVDTVKHANIYSGIVLEISTESSNEKLSFIPLSAAHATPIPIVLQSNSPDNPAKRSTCSLSCSASLVTTARLQL